MIHGGCPTGHGTSRCYCIVYNADGDSLSPVLLSYKEAAFGISMRLTNPAYVRSPSVRYIPEQYMSIVHYTRSVFVRSYCVEIFQCVQNQ